MLKNALARAVLALVWLLHFLPMPLLALLGRGFGLVTHVFAHGRRQVALTNLALCMPELTERQRRGLVRQHFQWAGRSLLERGLWWHASPQRLRRLVHVEGDPHLAQNSTRPVMWLVPHFVALEVAGIAAQLYQTRRGCDIYTPQSNAIFDAAFVRGRTRLGLAQLFTRQQGALAVVRAIKRGASFFNAADMDFGRRDAAFVPFFGQPAATLLAPSRMARALDMVVQPLVAEILPGGRGYCVHFMPPWTDWPTDDAVADAACMNQFIEEQIRHRPAQYLWVHKRFKTRPEGMPPVYE